MKNVWPKIALLLLCCAALAFELWHLRSSPRSAPQLTKQRAHKPDFALLPASEIVTFNDTYGKFLFPGVHARSWEPTLGDMEDVESELPQITKLTHRNLAPSSHLDPTQYIRQYLAIEVRGKNLLFVNGLCSGKFGVSDGWRKRLIVVNDGGACHWQAVYDRSTHTFDNFNVNGTA